MNPRNGVMRAAAWLLPLSLVGCAVYDDGHHHHPHDAPAPYAEPVPEPAPPASSAAPPPAGAPSAPLLVEIDTGQTMSADPGQGVGVFVEYAAGGHWQVWWTCDTAVSGLDCAYDIRVDAPRKDLRNVDFVSSELSSGTVTIDDEAPSSVELWTTTTTEMHGVRFDTDPGSVIRVHASLGGLTDGAFFFFVQDGQVNGGYEGSLTNPLEFQGRSP